MSSQQLKSKAPFAQCQNDLGQGMSIPPVALLRYNLGAENQCEECAEETGTLVTSYPAEVFPDRAGQ